MIRRFLGAVVAGAAVVAVLSSLDAAPARPGDGDVGWRVQRSPFALVATVAGRGVASEAASSTAGSLSYRLGDGTPHVVTKLLRQAPAPGGGTRYVTATDEPGRTAVVTVRSLAGGISVDVTLQPATGIGEMHEAFRSAADEHFLGGGENGEHVDLAGQVTPVAVNYGCDYVATPFYASSAGYGVFVAGTARSRFAFPANGTPPTSCGTHDLAGCALTPAARETQICTQSNELAYSLFVGSFQTLSRAYADAAGHAVMPPASEFALIKWRDEVASSADVLDDVTELQGRKIPIGWTLLDNPWEAGCVGRLRFDPARIGDPAALIRSVHARGVRFMLWVSPMATCPGAYPPGQLLQPVVPGTGYPVVNFENAAAVATYEARLRKLVALGVDGFKADRGGDFDVGATLNRYPVEYARAVMAALPGGAAIFQTGYAGSQALVPGIWGGDQPGDFVGLQRAIRLAQTAGVSGFPIWGSDTGGYVSGGETSEVFLRWAQLSSICPVFEVGGNGPNATFWQWGPQVVALFRASAVLHYELFPYLYELAQAATTTGVPILRPLGYQFPTDAAAWAANLELMVGPNLLAAPVIGPGTTPRVYVPRGHWVDLFAGSRIDGPASLTRQTPLSEFPLYLRRGTAIRFDFRTPELWPQAWRVDDLGRQGRAGWLYAPATGTTTRAPGFTATLRQGTVTLTLTDTSREREVLLVGVTVTRASVPRKATAAALRRASAGWAPATGSAFPGTVVKVPAGAGVVTLRVG